jgi:hypothetical protein
MTFLLFTCAVISAIVGCALLALSQERHWKAVTGKAQGAGQRFRLAGWLLLIASLVCCILCDGASFAALLWPLLAMLAAFAVAAALTWRPALLHPLASMFLSDEM